MVRDFGYSDEAVQLLRRALQLYPGKYDLLCFSTLPLYIQSPLLLTLMYFSSLDDPAFRTTQVYVRNNIAGIGNLTERMTSPNCSLVPLESSTTIDNIHSPKLTHLRSLCRSGRPLVLLGGSYTCPLFRYISHVVNDIYKEYQADVDFYMIQIGEAHANYVWPIGDIVFVKEHRTLADRLTAAREMVKATQLNILFC